MRFGCGRILMNFRFITISEEFAGSPPVFQNRNADKIKAMLPPPIVDDMIPQVASLAEGERIRLQRRFAGSGDEAFGYTTVPATRDEFSNDEESMTWDADGWTGV